MADLVPLAVRIAAERAAEKGRDTLVELGERMDQPFSLTEVAPFLGIIRAAVGMPQHMLGSKIGSVQSGVAEIESGTNDTRVSTLIRVAEALGIVIEVRLRLADPAGGDGV